MKMKLSYFDINKNLSVVKYFYTICRWLMGIINRVYEMNIHSGFFFEVISIWNQQDAASCHKFGLGLFEPKAEIWVDKVSAMVLKIAFPQWLSSQINGNMNGY